MPREAEIYCPDCEYRPKPEDRWACTPSCGTSWNTFWSRGVCPGYAVKWPHTQCFVCGQWAPHEAWYHYPPSSADHEQAEEHREKSVI